MLEKVNTIDFKTLSGKQLTILKDNLDETKLQSYINKIQEIRDINVSNMTTEQMAEFDSLQVQAYADALSDVESKQSALLLSTQGLNTAQIAETLIIKEGNVEKAYQAMAEAGLLKSKQELSNAEIQHVIQSKLGSKAKAEEAMKSMGLAVAIEGEEAQTVQLTQKKIALAVASGKLTKAQGAEILMHFGVTGAINAQNVSSMPKWIANMKMMTTATIKQTAATISWLATNPAGWAIGVGVALVGLVTSYNKVKDAIEETRQKAQELGNEFNNTKAEINDYKTQIEELQNTIKDSGSSIKDVTTARENLMVIQDELINKFGAEKESIDLITEAINGQSDALDTLTEKQWQVARNEFNNNAGFWNKVGNIFGGYGDEIERMRAEYGTYMTEIDFGKISFSNEAQKEEFIKMLDERFSDENFWRYDNDKYVLNNANASEIHDMLVEIQTLSNDFDFNDGFNNHLTNLANDAKEMSDQYKQFYDQYVLYEEILPNEKESAYYDRLTEAYESYNEARISGDKEAQAFAIETYGTILNEVSDNSNMPRVIDFLENMYPEIQEEVGKWEFETNFTANKDGLKDSVSDYLSGLEGLYSSDLHNFNYEIATDEQKSSYNALINLANQYDLTIDQLIDKLELMGLVQNENYQKLVSQFGQENIDKLLPEELSIAYEIENIGSMTFEDLQTEIKKIQGAFDEIPPTITDTVNAIHTRLKPALDSLADAYTNIFEDGFTLDNISTEEFIGIKDSLDSMSESGLDIDYHEYEEFVKVLSDTTSTADDVQEAFDSMATMMVNASGAVDITEENFNLLKQQLEELGITNADEVLSNLKDIQQELRDESIDLTNVTVEEAAVFINSAEASDEAKEYLKNYVLQKELAENPLDTTADIEALENVCKALGETGSFYEELIRLKSLYSASGVDALASVGAMVANDSKSMLKNALDDEYDYGSKFKYDGTTSGSKKSGSSSSSSKDIYKEKFEKELSDLQYLRDMGKLMPITTVM